MWASQLEKVRHNEGFLYNVFVPSTGEFYLHDFPANEKSSPNWSQIFQYSLILNHKNSKLFFHGKWKYPQNQKEIKWYAYRKYNYD